MTRVYIQGEGSSAFEDVAKAYSKVLREGGSVSSKVNTFVH
jgi:hypothetical protein